MVCVNVPFSPYHFLFTKTCQGINTSFCTHIVTSGCGDNHTLEDVTRSVLKFMCSAERRETGNIPLDYSFLKKIIFPLIPFYTLEKTICKDKWPFYRILHTHTHNGTMGSGRTGQFQNTSYSFI